MCPTVDYNLQLLSIFRVYKCQTSLLNEIQIICQCIDLATQKHQLFFLCYNFFALFTTFEKGCHNFISPCLTLHNKYGFLYRQVCLLDNIKHNLNINHQKMACLILNCLSIIICIDFFHNKYNFSFINLKMFGCFMISRKIISFSNNLLN